MSSRMWTSTQASQATNPVSRSRPVWATAALRPIVAMIPRSR